MTRLVEHLPKDFHKPKGKILQFFTMFLPYSWAYHSGFVDGMKKADYFKGMADGAMETHKFYAENAIFSVKRKKSK